MRQKVIALDFDGCLCHNAYSEIGEPNGAVIAAARREQEQGAILILWTCREGKLLEDAVAACKSWGLTLEAVNASIPSWTSAWDSDPRKIGATEYWDDRAVCADFFGVRRPPIRSHWNRWTTDAYMGMGPNGEPRYMDRYYYQCDNCHRRSVIKSPYCPQCGSKMEV